MALEALNLGALRIDVAHVGIALREHLHHIGVAFFVNGADHAHLIEAAHSRARFGIALDERKRSLAALLPARGLELDKPAKNLLVVCAQPVLHARNLSHLARVRHPFPHPIITKRYKQYNAPTRELRNSLLFSANRRARGGWWYPDSRLIRRQGRRHGPGKPFRY